MSTPLNSWEANKLQNSMQLLRNVNAFPNVSMTSGRNAPVLPPRPSNSSLVSNGLNSYNTNSYMPYSGMGYGTNSYGSYGMPYRSSIYNNLSSSYGGYNNYPMFGNGGYPYYSGDDHEQRFIQYAEESSRNTFASVEGVVRAFNSLAIMLDNTFFAMTSSFRAILGVAENFGRLRSMFGQIWYSVNIFRFITWLYRKMAQMVGVKIKLSNTSAAWREAAHGIGPFPSRGDTPGSSWPTLAFLGVLISAPYIISKFLPKYEDKGDPSNWKSPGIKAKAVFDFIGSTPNELTIQTNDNIVLAPTYIQEEMRLRNSGWAFATCKRKSGLVPLNYLVINKSRLKNSEPDEQVPIPRCSNTKTHTKRVSFGENQIFENIDLEDYIDDKDNISNNNDSCKLETHEKVQTSNNQVNVNSSNNLSKCENVKDTRYPEQLS